MHEFLIEDERGEVVNAVPLCSDACHREYAGAAYAGWSGAHESEQTTWCAQCGVVIPGFENGCDCQASNVVVNRFLSEHGERCKHGFWIQLPSWYLSNPREGS